MRERRQVPSPTDAEGYLRQLPALALLERLPTPMLGVDLDGGIAYANPACAGMLGYGDAAKLGRCRLPRLLAGWEERTPADCVQTLRRSASAVVEWNHVEDYVIRGMVTPPLLLRDSDTLLLIGIVDVTDWLWETEYARLG